MATKFLIRVNYTSGIQEEFWCKEFEIRGRNYSWEPLNPAGPKPLKLDTSSGNDQIESVWQLDAQEEL